MKQQLANYARHLYLDYHAALNYPEQEPNCEFARWWDVLWLAVPLFGIHELVAAIDRRAHEHSAL